MKEFLIHNILGLYIYKYLTRFKKVLGVFLKTENITQFHIDKTELLLKAKLSDSANCIDVGASKGDLLDIILDVCPNGRHIAIEPIPIFTDFMKSYYKPRNVKVLNALVLNSKDNNKFFLVKNQPAISGVTYQNKPEEKTIELRIKSFPLDDIVESGLKVDCIKIDCIGSELEVLKSAHHTLEKFKPLIVFECTVTHNSRENITEVYKLLTNLGYEIYTLKDFPIENKVSLETFLELIITKNICDYYCYC